MSSQNLGRGSASRGFGCIIGAAMKPDEASRRREGNWRQAGDGALVRSGTACPPATTSAEGWAIAGRFRTNRSHRRRDDETWCLPKSPGVTPWSLWVIGCHRRGWEGGSVTPPARDGLSMLAVGAGVVRKRSEGSTGTGGDVEASQVLRRHPPSLMTVWCHRRGRKGGGGGECSVDGRRSLGCPGGPAAAPLRQARRFGEQGLGSATRPCGLLRRWKDSA